MAEITREWLETHRQRLAGWITHEPDSLTYEEQATLLQWAQEAWDAMDDLKASQNATRDRANDRLEDISDLQERLGEAQERERRLKEALEDCVGVMAYGGDGTAYGRARALLEELKEVPHA